MCIRDSSRAAALLLFLFDLFQGRVHGVVAVGLEKVPQLLGGEFPVCHQHLLENSTPAQKILVLLGLFQLFGESRGKALVPVSYTHLDVYKRQLLIRPDPQILWSGEKKDPRWGQAHARYQRSSSGGGKWQNYKKVPPVWKIHWNGLTFRLKTMGFKHTGIFPEQAVNWEFAMEKIRQAGRPPEDPVRVLNLFGYTGAATLACMKAGAMVTHVDASKGMVQWARENAEASGIADRPVRWLVDDCLKSVSYTHLDVYKRQGPGPQLPGGDAHPGQNPQLPKGRLRQDFQKRDYHRFD